MKLAAAMLLFVAVLLSLDALGFGADAGATIELARQHRLLALIDGAALLVLALAAVSAWRAHRRLAVESRRCARAQEELRAFAGVMEQSADAVMITDANGVIEHVNPAFMQLTGFDADQVRGRTPQLLRSGEHDAPFYQRLWQTVTSGQIFREEFVNRRRDGTLYRELKSIAPLRNNEGHITHFVAIGREIAGGQPGDEEAQRRRERIAHTERMKIVGEMAANIAHEINQPLTAIINDAQGSIRRIRAGDIDSERLLDVLDRVVAQSQRATNSILTLRSFVTAHKSARVNADINELVRAVIALAVAETRKRGIAIVFDLAPELPSVRVDEIQIEQVILELLRNGAEALASADGKRRELLVRTGLDEEGNIEISLSDTGPGLPPRLAAKLFEPFFSSKTDGADLGLAVSRAIIETHGGRIWVTPNSDRGVTFRFTLPLTTGAHEP